MKRTVHEEIKLNTMEPQPSTSFSNLSPSTLILKLNEELSKLNFDNALKILKDKANNKVIIENSQRIIQEVVLVHLTNENHEKQLKLYEACECILKELGEQCYKDKVFVFELLQILEGHPAPNDHDDNIFISVMKGMRTLLLCQEDMRTNVLSTCLTAIEDYLKRIKLPPLLKKKCLEEEEEKLLENDDVVKRILMIYMTLDHYFTPLILEVSNNKEDVNRCNVLFCFFLRLLRKPFGSMDLSLDEKKDAKKTYSREVAENFVATLCVLNNSFFNMLEIFEERVRWPTKGKIDKSVKAILRNPEQTPTIEFGLVMFMMYAEEICFDRIPKVYNPMYLLKKCLYLVDAMLQDQHESIKLKGMILCYWWLNLEKDQLFESDEIDLDIYRTFCDNLVKVLIYSPSQRNRSFAVNVLKAYLLKFQIDARFSFIKYIMKTSNHMGVIGYVTMLYKDMIFDTLETPSEYIKGANFKIILLEHICKLDKGVETDLGESMDLIIPAMNFVYGMMVRDKNNVTGIKDLFPTIVNTYFSDLHQALYLSRSHFSAEMNRIKTLAPENKIVGNFFIPNHVEEAEKLPTKQRMGLINLSFNKFDLIEYHIARINDYAAKI